MPDNERLTELEVRTAVHAQQLKDHDEVLKDLRDHLQKLVDSLGSVEKKLIVIALLAIGSDKVPAILSALGIG